MKQLALLSIAILLAIVLLPIGFFVQCVVSFFSLPRYFRQVALSIDQLGNVVCETLLNSTLIRWSSAHKFGNEDETISSVIGKNYVAGTLTWLGSLLRRLLDSIDTNHSKNSIDQ